MRPTIIALRVLFFAAVGVAVFVASAQTIALIAAGTVLLALMVVRSIVRRKSNKKAVFT